MNNNPLPLRKNRSYNNHNVNISLLNGRVQDVFKTPLEARGRPEATFKSTVKPPMPSGGTSGQPTTEKREMSPKAWKANRIRNHNKKVNQDPKIQMRRPYSSIDKGSATVNVFDNSSYKTKLNKDVRKAKVILYETNKNSKLNEESKGYEDLSDEDSIEDGPSILAVKPTRQPSFLSDKKGDQQFASNLTGRSSKDTSQAERRNLDSKTRPGLQKKNPNDPTTKNFEGKYHNVRFNHGKHMIEQEVFSIAKLRNDCIKANINKDEHLKPPSIIRCFSDNIEHDKSNINSISCLKGGICEYVHCFDDTSLEMETEEIQEEPRPNKSKPMKLELKKFYSEGIYLNPTTNRVKAGEHVLNNFNID